MAAILAWVMAPSVAADTVGVERGFYLEHPEGSLDRVQVQAEVDGPRVVSVLTVDIGYAWRDRRPIAFDMRLDPRQRLARLSARRVDMDDFVPWVHASSGSAGRAASLELGDSRLGTPPMCSAVQGAAGSVSVRVRHPLPAAGMSIRIELEQAIERGDGTAGEFAAPVDFGERTVGELHVLLRLPPPIDPGSVQLVGDFAAGLVLPGGAGTPTQVYFGSDKYRARQAAAVRWHRAVAGP